METLASTARDILPRAWEPVTIPAVEHDHDSAYGEERIREVETLCDPRVRAAINRFGVDLRSFARLDY